MNGTKSSYELLEAAQRWTEVSYGENQDRDAETPANSLPEAEGDGQNNEHKPSDQPQSLADKINDWFVWEILGMATSAGVLIALAVVLAKYDRIPEPRWRYVSLNSLISWLSTIFRACIIISTNEALGQLKWIWFSQKQERLVQELRVYDSASRGAYGALQLIWTLRAR